MSTAPWVSSSRICRRSQGRNTRSTVACESGRRSRMATRARALDRVSPHTLSMSGAFQIGTCGCAVHPDGAKAPHRAVRTSRRAKWAKMGSLIASSLAGAGVEVDVHPFLMQGRMLPEADNLRLHQHVANAAVVYDPGRIHLYPAGHRPIELVALGTIGQRPGFLVELVELRRLITRIVALPGIRSVEQLHAIIAIRVVGDPGCAMHHQAAAFLQLEQIGEAVLVDFQVDADRVERALHQFVELAVALDRDRGITDDEGLAVGHRAIAVHAPPVAEFVEQSVGGPRIVRDAELVARIMARDAGRNRKSVV